MGGIHPVLPVPLGVPKSTPGSGLGRQRALAGREWLRNAGALPSRPSAAAGGSGAIFLKTGNSSRIF